MLAVNHFSVFLNEPILGILPGDGRSPLSSAGWPGRHRLGPLRVAARCVLSTAEGLGRLALFTKLVGCCGAWTGHRARRSHRFAAPYRLRALYVYRRAFSSARRTSSLLHVPLSASILQLGLNVVTRGPGSHLYRYALIQVSLTAVQFILRQPWTFTISASYPAIALAFAFRLRYLVGLLSSGHLLQGLHFLLHDRVSHGRLALYLLSSDVLSDIFRLDRFVNHVTRVLFNPLF